MVGKTRSTTDYGLSSYHHHLRHAISAIDAQHLHLKLLREHKGTAWTSWCVSLRACCTKLIKRRCRSYPCPGISRSDILIADKASESFHCFLPTLTHIVATMDDSLSRAPSPAFLNTSNRGSLSSDQRSRSASLSTSGTAPATPLQQPWTNPNATPRRGRRGRRKVLGLKTAHANQRGAYFVWHTALRRCSSWR